MNGEQKLQLEQIRDIRIKQGLSEKEFAKKIGITKRTLIKYEKGLIHPPIDKVIKISEILGVDMFTILEDESIENKPIYKNENDNDRLNRTSVYSTGIDKSRSNKTESNRNDYKNNSNHVMKYTRYTPKAVNYLYSGECDLCGYEFKPKKGSDRAKFFRSYVIDKKRNDKFNPNNIAILCPECYARIKSKARKKDIIKIEQKAQNRVINSPSKIMMLSDFNRYICNNDQ